MTNFTIDAIMGNNINIKQEEIDHQEDNSEHQHEQEQQLQRQQRTDSSSSSSSSSSSTTDSSSNGAAGGKRPRPKKYQCPFCWVALSNSGQFKGHMRIHTGERPFRCDHAYCEKTFTRNEELTRHKRIHTGERPYACPQCNKSFGRKDHLKKHMRTHERHAAHLQQRHQAQQHQVDLISPPPAQLHPLIGQHSPQDQSQLQQQQQQLQLQHQQQQPLDMQLQTNQQQPFQPGQQQLTIAQQHPLVMQSTQTAEHFHEQLQLMQQENASPLNHLIMASLQQQLPPSYWTTSAEQLDMLYRINAYFSAQL